MLHNKHFEVLQQYLGDYNREIYGRELIGKVSLSQKNIALTLEDLEEQGILKSRKSGNMRYYRLNLDNKAIRDILLIAETGRKTKFFDAHLKIANLFKHDARIIGIFGSYARGNEKKDSDIDIFIIGDRIKDDYDKQGKVFDLDISIKYFKEKEVIGLLKNKNNLWKEIIANHVVIFGCEQLIGLIWRNYYGFD